MSSPSNPIHYLPRLSQGNLERHQQAWQDRLAKHRELAQADVAAERQAFFNLPHIPAERYRETPWAHQDLSGWMGIRFRNLDPRTPYVELWIAQAPEHALRPQNLAALKQQVLEYYGIFDPLGFTLRVPVSQARQTQVDQDCTRAHLEIPHKVWSNYWAGPLHSLKAAISAQKKSAIRLSPASIDNFDHARFQAQHQFWRLLNGPLAPWVEAAQPEELQDSMHHGLCFEAYNAQNEKVGLIAGLPEGYAGHPGILMLEEFIYPMYQQQGYGMAMQSAFIDNLYAHQPAESLLWGTIYAENEASWRTARACGRKVVEQECFISLMD